MSENLLAVDTSSRVLSVAIQSAEGNIFEANLQGTPRHSEQLIHLIEEGLNCTGIKKKDLKSFIWGLGPGSFTGLRIGLSVLKGLHLGLKKESWGASSLDLIALGVPVVSGDIAVCVDARRQTIYFALYRYEQGKLKKILREEVISFDELMKRLTPGTIITGDALQTYGAKIKEQTNEMTFLAPVFWYPRALFAIHLFDSQKTWLEKLSLKKMQPKYIR